MIAEETKSPPYFDASQENSFTMEEAETESNVIEPSTEDGFTGPPSSWFTDKQYEENTRENCAKNRYLREREMIGYQELILSDLASINSYMSACKYNSTQIEGKVVLNVGCGTGIMAIFALRAGAKHVFAVDSTDIANFAKRIIRDNGYEDRVTVIKGKMEEVELPVGSVDIILSRWMGYFLLHESLIDAMINARDRYLSEGGMILPNKSFLYLVAIEDSQYKQERFGSWENMYGIDMECIREAALSEPVVEHVNAEQVITTTDRIAEIDLYQANPRLLDFKFQFILKLLRTKNIYAIVGWFDVCFSSLKFSVVLPTSPSSARTHWRQVTMYLPEVIVAKEGGILTGTLSISRSDNNKHLNIALCYCYQDDVSNVRGSKMYKLR
eukprot:TRINITY_DN5534_c0_g1_i5.p1 TRINITY_DN5534_c0_g1~~TRINITY_DN5534_c0_g1_i5.p1  ORF type:complete len:384 (-),score=70.16 TRINITY_DN5534_c0_g1_i5:131-1282(-)